MQKTIKLFIGLVALTGMCSCQGQGEQSDSTTLFPTCDVASQSDGSEQVKELLNRGRIVRLETNDSSLIGGRFSKYLKRDSHFYVKSMNDVIVFDADGKFIGKLAKSGKGKGEYGRIEDFDVVTRDNDREIWVAADKGINRYDAESFDFLGKTQTDDYLRKFCYVNDTTIITETPGEQTLRIIDINGNVRKTFLDKDVANNVLKPVQFRRMGDRVIYQISDTDEAVVYNPADDSFTTIEIIPSVDGLLTPANNQEYYEKYGYMDMTPKVAENFTTISSFQMYGPQYMLTSFHPDGSKTITVGNQKESFTRPIAQGEILLKDGVTISEPRFLLTVIACDSDNGFLFMISPESVEGEDPDANPLLLDIEL